MYQFFDHTADIGLRIRAPDFETLMAEGGAAICACLVDKPNAIRPTEQRVISLSNEERDYLLFDWLSELLFLFESEQLVFSRFEIKLDRSGGMRAQVFGECFSLDRHGRGREIKAVTYHGLRVERAHGGWFAEVILDI